MLARPCRAGVANAPPVAGSGCWCGSLASLVSVPAVRRATMNGDCAIVVSHTSELELRKLDSRLTRWNGTSSSIVLSSPPGSARLIPFQLCDGESK